MSSLSSLLNPAPSSTETGASKAHQVAPLQLDGQDYRSELHQTGYNNAQSPAPHVVTSPGLDVLAAAASETAPLMSPTEQQASLTKALFQETQDSPGSEVKPRMLPKSQILSEPGPQQHSSKLEPYGCLEMDRDHLVPEYIEDSRRLAPYSQTLHTQDDSTTAMGYASGNYSGQPVAQRATDSSPAVVQTQHQPNMTQLQNPSSQGSPPLSTEAVANGAEHIQVKAELADTRDMKTSAPMLMSGSATASHDSTLGTPLKNVMSNNSPDRTSLTEESPAILPKPKTAPTKKRPAPRKGTAAKPPAKKRKVETESGKASPRTGTPATSRASGTPAPRKGKTDSATPTRSSSVANPEDDEDDGELELFCICRKPDDHTVMLACDGPCEDWFHVRCVNMTNEKVVLISKWYCPNCAAEGHETEWKRMCRLDGCSKPALSEAHKSKYCCKEHGQEFMERHLSANEMTSRGTNASRKRRRDNMTDHDGNETDDTEEPDDNRGGVLRPGELKALVDGVKDVVTFRKLGDGVLSPPETAAPSPGHETEKKIVFNSEEARLLDEIAAKRADIEGRRDMLNDREKLVHMIERRRKDVLTKLKEKEKSLKDICGYDARLTWSDEELNSWRNSEEGRHQLEKVILNVDPRLVDAEEREEGVEREVGLGACKKKRCERHRTWYKVQQQDNAMEREDVRQKLKKMDEEEKSVKERAMIRGLEEGHEAVV